MTQKNSVTLRDKIGQMLIIGFEGKTVTSDSAIIQTIQRDNLGGVILFDYNQRKNNFDHNITSPAQVKQLNTDLQQFNFQGHAKYNRPPLPLIISVDYEGGEVNRLKENYGFPATFSGAEMGKMPIEAVRKIAADMAITLKNLDFNLNYAPMLDLNLNPDNPIIGKKNRPFSADPVEVIKYARIFTQEFAKHKLICVYKHFPGHGSATGDSHLNFVDVTTTWQKQELEPYQALLQLPQHCAMIMTAHIINKNLDPSGLPATLSKKVLSDLLRQEYHFTGVILSDDMQMKAITNHYSLEEALTLAINAGNDMLIFANQLDNIDPQVLINLIENQVNKGAIPSKRIDEAYAHIVRLKEEL